MLAIVLTTGLDVNVPFRQLSQYFCAECCLKVYIRHVIATQVAEIQAATVLRHAADRAYPLAVHVRQSSKWLALGADLLRKYRVC